MEPDPLDREIDDNYDFFRRNLATYLPHHLNQFALLRSQNLVGFFDEVRDADHAASAKFPDGIYSIQIVRHEPVDLGFFSHAGR